MMKCSVIAIMLVTMVGAAPVYAEHGSGDRNDSSAAAFAAERPGGTEGPLSQNLDLQLKLGRQGFRLGGRVMGREGVAGAWVNGQVVAGGLSVDGRVQRGDGRAWNFKFDAELTDWWARTAARLLLGTLD